MKNTTHTHLTDPLHNLVLLSQYESLLFGSELPAGSENCAFLFLLSAGLLQDSGMQNEMNKKKSIFRSSLH